MENSSASSLLNGLDKWEAITYATLALPLSHSQVVMVAIILKCQTLILNLSFHILALLFSPFASSSHEIIKDTPIVSLKMGSSLNPDDIKEGDDVYFECDIRSNPKPYRKAWYHNVSANYQRTRKWNIE